MKVQMKIWAFFYLIFKVKVGFNKKISLNGSSGFEL
jgi:hypothetical protein